jgi:hypothetical protein
MKQPTRATEEDIAKARALGNVYDPDVFGRFPWDRSERRGKQLGLSRTALGEFANAVLSSGGDITNFFVMHPTVKNSSVFVRVHLTIQQREKLEKETPYRFDAPPVAKVN